MFQTIIQMKKHIYILSLLLFTIFACSNPSSTTKQEAAAYTQLAFAKRMLGNWQNQFPEGIATESWELLDDSTYTGKSLVVIGKDTVSSESIQLQQRGTEVSYIPTVKEQNGGKPIPFLLTSSSENQFVFENPEHDFPQKISYTFFSNDSLVAEISGNINGEQKAEQFPMKRIQ